MKLWGLFLCMLFISCGETKTSEKNQMKIEWDTLAIIPPAQGKTLQIGLAGALTGIHNNRLFIAGGANFEDALPWNGGTKLYHDEVFILQKDADGNCNWTFPDTKLSVPTAYSACVSLEDGIICLGGENTKGFLNCAKLISIEEKELQIKNLPELPFAVSNAGAAAIGKTIFLAGGIEESGASSRFLSLDISEENATWQILPELPEALSHAVVVAQSDGNEKCIFVLSGRSKSGTCSTFHSTIWKYSPGKKEWLKAGSLKKENGEYFGLSAGTGLAYEQHSILILGGDEGKLFNKTERFIYSIDTTKNPHKKQQLIDQKIAHLNGHPGFSKKIYQFNTITGKVTQLNDFPGMAQVTTTAFWWNNEIIIPSGEIRPGVRTPVISRGKIVLMK